MPAGVGKLSFAPADGGAGTVEVDALIIGGGIIGSAIAWRLAGEKVRVTVLERGRLGREASWAAAGMLTPQAEAEGPGPFLELCVRARLAFQAISDRLARESGIDFEYDRRGILYVGLDEQERAELERRARWQLQAGLVVEMLSGAQARELAPALTPQALCALHFPDDRRLDNRKLTQAFINAAMRAGAEFVEGAQVDEVVVDRRLPAVRLHDGSTCGADVVVNAAGAWASHIRPLEHDGVIVRPVRGQILCFAARPGALDLAIFSSRGYIVPRRDGRLIVGSTREEAGYDKSVTLAGMERIACCARALLPKLGGLAFCQAWAGLRPAASDLLPVLGSSPGIPGLVYATGHYRSGILLSALTAELIADLVMGRKPPVELAPFQPARFKSAGEWMR